MITDVISLHSCMPLIRFALYVNELIPGAVFHYVNPTGEHVFNVALQNVSVSFSLVTLSAAADEIGSGGLCFLPFCSLVCSPPSPFPSPANYFPLPILHSPIQ